MDKNYLLDVRRQAVELCIIDGIMLTPENIINALSELGYIVAPPNTSVQSDGACAHAKLEAYEFGHYCKDCGMANPPRR